MFGVSASDPLTLAAVAAALWRSSRCMASLVPAYRASRLDPSEVLRASYVRHRVSVRLQADAVASG